MSDDKNNKVVQTDNHYSVTKEAYTILAEKYQDLLQEIAQKVSICTMHFDEAFTKHRHANPSDRKLKDFEVHEKRLKAKRLSFNIVKDLEETETKLVEGVKKYGVELKGVDNE